MNIDPELFQDLDIALARLKDFEPDDLLKEPECEDAVRQVSDLDALQAYVPWLKVSPTRFGQYLLYEKIGEGGMGTVYRAEHVHLKKSVALKVIAKNREQNLAAHSQFWREMASLGKLNHPNLVTAHDAGTYDGIQFLVMELVEGVNLSQLVKHRGPLDLPDAAAIVCQVAEALCYLEERELLHRDIKPSNLMMTTDGAIKLLDLGVAENLSDRVLLSQGKESDPSIVGTLKFLAPEVLNRESPTDSRSELFSLGCTLLFLLTGKSPRRKRRKIKVGQAETIPVNGEVIIPDELPQAAKEVLGQLLAYDPEERIQTPEQVIPALNRLSVDARLEKLEAEVEFIREMDRGLDVEGDISLILPASQRESTRTPLKNASENIGPDKSVGRIQRLKTWLINVGATFGLAALIFFAVRLGFRDPVENSPTERFGNSPGAVLNADDRESLQAFMENWDGPTFPIVLRSPESQEVFSYHPDQQSEEPIQVLEIGRLDDAPRLTSSQREQLQQFQNLEKLYISLDDLSSNVMESLMRNSNLIRLKLVVDRVTLAPADLRAFAELESLRNLSLSVIGDKAWEIDGESLAVLGESTHLNSLTFSGNVRFSSDSSTAWNKFWSVIDLHLHGNRFNREAIAEIADLPNLRIFDLQAQGMAPEALRPLRAAHLQQLHLIDVHELTDQVLNEILETQTELRELDLQRARLITGACLSPLAESTTLESLRVQGSNRFDSGSLAHCARMGALKRLDLSNTLLDAESLHQLSQLPQIELINLSGTGYTPALLEELRSALPDAKISPKANAAP